MSCNDIGAIGDIVSDIDDIGAIGDIVSDIDDIGDNGDIVDIGSALIGKVM